MWKAAFLILRKGVEITVYTEALFTPAALMPSKREQPCLIWPCVMTLGGQTG